MDPSPRRGEIWLADLNPSKTLTTVNDTLAILLSMFSGRP